MRCEIDHLVFACDTLEHGARWLRERTGVEPQAGGRHATMGTHNRLARLGERCYLELIALDPDGAAPPRPRWFDLDAEHVRARLRDGPFLLTWVARCDAAIEAITLVPALGELVAFERGAFRWRLSVPDDGALQFGGVLPSVIEWEEREDATWHPADALEDRALALQELKLSHPAATSILPLFRALRVSGPVHLRPGPRELVARVRTPNGEVDLF
jgi:hypothetical protein